MTKLKLIVSVAILCLAVGASADMLKLRSGETVQGVFLGADSSQLTFQGPNEQPVTYPLGDVSGVTFAAPAPAAPPPPPPPPTPSQPKPNTATLLAGAIIPVRMITSLSTEQSRVGDVFTGTLDSNLLAGNVIVARRGTTVHGSVIKSDNAGRLMGKSELQLQLTDIVINGSAVPISTNGFEQKGGSEGANTAKKTAGGAGLGAIIGSFSGNAGKGAAIGAVAGLGVSMTAKGKPIRFPSETLLQFSLSQPTIVPVQI